MVPNVAKSLRARLIESGFDDVIIFDDCSYDDALIGVTADHRAVYDFDRMVEGLKEKDHLNEEAAVEWVAYNTIPALPSEGPGAPIIVYKV